MSDLLMICPSRGRPQNVAELIEAWQLSASEAQLLVAVDDDDPCLEAYLDLASLGGVEFYVGPRLRIGCTINRLAVNCASEHFAIGFMGDDHRPRTKGWDKAFVEALRELGTGFVYGDDLFQSERLPTAVAMTSDIVRELGYMVPPGLTHMYFDNYWLGLGKALHRIRYLPEVVIEHLHPIAEKAEWDDGYREVNAPAIYAQDQAVFSRWIREDSQDALQRVRAIRR